jgi:hypothetical protein
MPGLSFGAANVERDDGEEGGRSPEGQSEIVPEAHAELIFEAVEELVLVALAAVVIRSFSNEGRHGR